MFWYFLLFNFISAWGLFKFVVYIIRFLLFHTSLAQSVCLCCCLIFILCIWWLGGPSGFKVLRYLFLVFVVFVPFRLA